MPRNVGDGCSCRHSDVERIGTQGQDRAECWAADPLHSKMVPSSDGFALHWDCRRRSPGSDSGIAPTCLVSLPSTVYPRWRGSQSGESMMRRLTQYLGSSPTSRPRDGRSALNLSSFTCSTYLATLMTLSASWIASLSLSLLNEVGSLRRVVAHRSCPASSPPR